MGGQADDILHSFGLSEEDQKNYTVVKDRFERHFVKRRNVIYERAKFNSRKQQEGEPVDMFITDLYSLAEHCSFGDLRDELIRDRIVVGLRSAALSEKLQLDPDLTLESALTRVRQAEAIKQQQGVIRGDGTDKTDLPVGFLKGKPNKRTRKPKDKVQPTGPPTTAACSRCGSTPTHDRSLCPAKDVSCRKCGKRGHYARACRTAKIRVVHETEEAPFMGVVTAGERSESPWTATILLNGRPVLFHLDTGADATVIPTGQLEGAELQSPHRTLRGPSQAPLPVTGQFEGHLTLSNVQTQQTVYVAENLLKPLLGRPAIEALGLLVRVRAVQEHQNPIEQFPGLFRGLGKVKGDYSIKLQEGAKPFALTTPRRVPIPLMDRVREELKNMERLGVISRVEEPSEWCAGMVVVPKANGRVRICVDLTKLNEKQTKYRVYSNS